MSETRATGTTAKDIFIEVCDLPPDRRADELERRTAHDPSLRAAVLSLLDAHDRAGVFLAGRGAPLATVDVPTDLAQRQIGPYKVLQVIGEGGFGTVYLAEQEQPVRRRVALKVIKPGMDTRGVIARFEQERQALAMMDHANIAKVFDAGTTPDGRPFFVMELVKGVPVTEFCDTHHLGIRARLELFAQVCAAVQHAHQKGLIHRDIKPSNVLVSLQDDKPLAKVIDFGIAKATQARLTEKTVFTEMRQLIGTPEYMSPEQAEGSLDIDTRTDVYALGVLLYELLTGTTPFDARELRSKAYGEMQRVIREVEPPRPSTRLSGARDTLPTIAARRGVEPRKLTTLLRGDLDWVVMKAIDKDRARRYESASGLASDVQRFLADEPVSAGPPGAAYRLRKFVRRNRALVVGSAAVLLALLAGIISTSVFAVQARRERNEAVAQRERAEAARLAEQQAREFERGTDRFLLDLFESMDPTQARGKPVLVGDVLDRAVQRIDSNPPEHRRPEASLRFIFGTAYASIGMLEPAHKQLQKAAEIYQAEWGDDDFRTPKVLNSFGQVSAQLGKLEEAERTLSKAVELNRKIHGPAHEETLATENALADVYLKRGKATEAEAMLSDLLARTRRAKGPDGDDALAVLSVVAGVKSQLGKYAEAEQLLREALDAARTRHGDDHPYAIAFRTNLADLLRTRGQVAEAEPLLRQSHDAARRVYGIDHPTALTITNNLALTLDALGRYDEAEPLYLDVVERRRRVLGEDHPSTLTARNNHALLLQNTGRFDQGELIVRDVLERGRRALGQDHPNVLLWTNNLAWLLVARGDHAGAEAIYRDLVPRARQALGPKHPMTVSLMTRYGHVLATQNRLDDAEPLLADAYTGAQALGLASTQGGFAANYGTLLVRREKYPEALPVLLQADEALRRAPKRDPNAERRVADALVAVYEKLGPPERADEWRRRRDAIATQPSTTTSPAAPASQP